MNVTNPLNTSLIDYALTSPAILNSIIPRRSGDADWNAYKYLGVVGPKILAFGNRGSVLRGCYPGFGIRESILRIHEI